MIDLTALNERWKTMPALEIVRDARENIFGTGLVMSSHFGSTSALLLHIATDVDPDIPVIYIEDPATRDFAGILARRFQLNLHVYQLMDDKLSTLQEAVRHLGGSAILHGIRAYQTENRAQKRFIELGEDDIYRIHPVLDWTNEKVDAYFAEHRLPRHPSLADEVDKVECGIHCFIHAGDGI